MSGFAVVYQRKESPVEGLEQQAPRAPLAKMLEALEHRGPDGVDRADRPPFALGARHFWTTPEEVGERQPLADEKAGLWLVFDGRLDNREELLAALGEPRSLGGHLSDAKIVLAAYRRWRSGCFERFLGPFAAAICDRSSGVVCARDLLGDRSLYYRVDGERLLVASEEQSILACPGVSAALDENRLAHFFAARVPEDSSTFFEDVRELRPGHLLSVDSGRVDVLRYARLEPPEPIHCRDDRDYAARYRELLRQSIACRSRSTSAVAVMMSGGLDSTSLVALAAAEGATQVRPASWIFDELESCDERRFMDPVVERYGLGAIRFRGDGHWPLSEPGLYNANPNAPEENAYRGLKRSLYRMVAKSGCRVALNGGSADQLYFGSQQWLADLLREGRLVEVVVGGWRELQKRGARSVAATLLRKAGLLRPPAGTWFSRAPWLTEQARRRLTSQDDARWSHWRRPAQCRNVFGAREAHSLAREVFHTNREAIDLRHPYRDRRLIDFMLAIPAHQLYHRGRFKHAARQAVWDLLPAGILVRTDRTLLTPLFERGLWRREAERVGEILGHKDAVWPRYVRPDWLEGVRRGGGEHPVDGVILWQCVAFELWRRRWGRS